jgi:hypothetical protein
LQKLLALAESFSAKANTFSSLVPLAEASGNLNNFHYIALFVLPLRLCGKFYFCKAAGGAKLLYAIASKQGKL